MFLSVIIPTRGHACALQQTLDSLAEQWPEGVAAGCEVIVVCDGDPATRALRRKYSAIPVDWIEEDLPCLAAARNSGAAKAHGEILLFLNDDTPAAAGLLDLHLDAHQRYACAGPSSRVAVCGRVVEDASDPRSETGQLLCELANNGFDGYTARLRVEEGERILSDAAQMRRFGLNCSIAREVFMAIGGFNPALQQADGERELGCRLYTRGVLFVCEPSAVVHRRTPVDYVQRYEQSWAAGGRDDVLRAVEMQERNGQTRQLLAMDTGPLLSQLLNRGFWYGNAAARGLSSILRKVTERTGWRGSFQLWQEVASRQRYWQAVRETGVKREELRALTGNPLRVALLHSITTAQDAREASYCLSPPHLRKLLETMRAEGYVCADPAKLEDESAQWGRRELLLTFDDGYADFYQEVFPFIESYALKPLMFVVVGRIGGWNLWDQAIGYRPRQLLNASQIRELRRYGVRFGSHTLTHPRLPNASDEQLRRELRDSKHKLEDLIGDAVTMLAYPFGAANRRVRAAAIEAGYKAAFTTTEGLNVWQDRFAIMRADFNDLVAARFFAWKLRHGVGPRRSLKEQAMPVLQLMPRVRQQPLESARNQLGHAA